MEQQLGEMENFTSLLPARYVRRKSDVEMYALVVASSTALSMDVKNESTPCLHWIEVKIQMHLNTL